ncbi:hypothetical protein P7C70_g2941, partial [Phenoliferia sp. Uapishka_3]
MTEAATTGTSHASTSTSPPTPAPAEAATPSRANYADLKLSSGYPSKDYYYRGGDEDFDSDDEDDESEGVWDGSSYAEKKEWTIKHQGSQVGRIVGYEIDVSGAKAEHGNSFHDVFDNAPRPLSLFVKTCLANTGNFRRTGYWNDRDIGMNAGKERYDDFEERKPLWFIERIELDEEWRGRGVGAWALNALWGSGEPKERVNEDDEEEEDEEEEFEDEEVWLSAFTRMTPSLIGANFRL